jgi:secreted PhoX family phosphatase
MIDRRLFLKALALAAATPARVIGADGNSHQRGFGELVKDPDGLLDLPEGFRYSIIARFGEEMDDGLLRPGLPDGMAAFDAGDGTVKLVCNHELWASRQSLSAFGEDGERLAKVDASKLYDRGNGTTPGAGGTTTIHYDPATGERLGIHLSLAGTEINCAGGPTPWRSWLSCEETFSTPGTGFERGRVIHREKHHGYVFEVPVDQDGLADPVPLTAMGRFEHEAAAVEPRSGIVYMTEDRHRSLFYRFIPDVPGKLREGGRLQALKVTGRPRFDTRNWQGPNLKPGEWLEVEWVDLDEPDVETNDLRLRGHEKGAAMFARGEGLCRADGDFAFTATIGGPERLGQVFVYRPSPAEGSDGEHSEPGRLSLIAESPAQSILRNADNLTLSPWGDLVVCEDTAGYCGMVGISPDGGQYRIAGNAWQKAELAGVCFSPDGSTLFVNVQQANVTLAITGPWSTQA